MSRELAPDQLPQRVQELFDGEDLADDFGLAYELATVDDDGWPRVAMLSHGEILAVDPQRLRFALWTNTNTGKNLTSGRPGLLSVVTPGFVCYIGGHAKTLSRDDGMDLFELEVEKVRTDQHKGLPVVSPITFTSEDEETSRQILDLWRKQVDTMRNV